MHRDDDDKYPDTACCNQECKDHNDCHGYICSHCDADPGHVGKCVPGAPCAAECNVDLDCNQLGGCPVCVGGTCTANFPCHTPCKNNNQCPNQKCTQCEWPGICVPGGPCLSECRVDTDCNRLGLCRWCVNEKCLAACGQPGDSPEQCEPACPYVTDGVCRPFDSMGSFVSFSPDSPAPPAPSPPSPPSPSDDCDNDYLEVTVRVPKSAACKKCASGTCAA
eukprot:TRINITY_DN7123_c0_g1_i1.p2 TRINITY_DN7123_c0_g1~~TRINITY_DN7123_c0_g1_i1.p2  ORF type:complete len:257 (+),score=40.53 TRINITY_DN7123_c0_g1_i1:109-771(+)